MRRSERVTFLVLTVLSLTLRAVAFLHYRFDSDEPQHLHVAWSWTAGLVPYRDVFDNHTPLFHILTAPLLSFLGERADILLYMRAPMLLLFAAVIVCTYFIGRSLYSARVGAWAALLLSLFPPFFLKSLEYRSDNFWNALWMVALLFCVRQPLNTKQLFVAGLLGGAALAASIKTILLLIAAGAASLMIGWIKGGTTTIARPIIAAFAGLAIVPVAVVLYFVHLDAIREMYYGIVTFNSALAGTRTLAWTGRIVYPFALGAVFLAARKYGGVATHRLFVATLLAVYVITLVALWLLISPRDLLPMMPLMAIFFVAWLDRFQRRHLALALIALACVAALPYYADRFENRTDEHITMMNQALRLTHPGEPLMDIKGETIFRRRPFYYAFEVITREQVRRGIIRDTIPERIIETRTYAAQADGPMLPPRGRRFLTDNFLDMGRLRAAGQWIPADGRFTIAIPGPYVVVDDRGHARGTLDGNAYSGERDLAAGVHRFDRANAGQRIAVLWARAFERGHSPFHLRDREF